MKTRVLIIDDEETVRNALIRSLRSEGYAISASEGPRDAWEDLLAHPTDIVISDFRMPRMDGLEFLRRVRDHFPATIRIMISGCADAETVISAVNEGEVFRFLTKPWKDEELKFALRLAVTHLEVSRENQRLLELARRYEHMLRRAEAASPGITRVARDPSGAVIIKDVESDG